VLALTLWLLAAPPVPSPYLADAPVAVSPGLSQARKLADDLRFEEAVVAYQKYLGDSTRPSGERAQALLELALLHQVLADQVSAVKRAVEALELSPAEGFKREEKRAGFKLSQLTGKVRGLGRSLGQVFALALVL
jgi:hypothetical protein